MDLYNLTCELKKFLNKTKWLNKTVYELELTPKELGYLNSNIVKIFANVKAINLKEYDLSEDKLMDVHVFNEDDLNIIHFIKEIWDVDFVCVHNKLEFKNSFVYYNDKGRQLQEFLALKTLRIGRVALNGSYRTERELENAIKLFQSDKVVFKMKFYTENDIKNKRNDYLRSLSY